MSSMFEGRHRAAPTPPTPWRQRPREPLYGSLHRLHLMAAFVIWASLWAGGSLIFTALSLLPKLGGALCLLCGALLTTAAVLYVRRPVWTRSSTGS